MVYFTVQSPSNYFPTPRSTLHSTRGTRAVPAVLAVLRAILSTVLIVHSTVLPQYSQYSNFHLYGQARVLIESHYFEVHPPHSSFVQACIAITCFSLTCLGSPRHEGTFTDFGAPMISRGTFLAGPPHP